MTVLSAQSIRKRKIFMPFHERMVHNGKTFGLGPAGYDIRIAETVILGKDRRGCGITGQVYLADYGNKILASAMEHMSIPEDCIAYVKDKSSYAREFLLVQNTVIEPGWHGFLTLELTFEGEGSIRIEKGDPIAQIIIHKLDEETQQPYDGKYQGQAAGAQPAKYER